MLLYLVLLVPLLLALRLYRAKKKLPKSNLPAPVVKTKNGKVSGSWDTSSAENRQFASFKGIPYAKPPIGKLRFMRPEPVDNWTEELECTRTPEIIQINSFQSGSPRVGKEDALVLNIFSPNLRGRLPVMVFIHGGGFVSGSSSPKIYGAEHFMNKDVVMVSINYRLGVLGWLYLDGDKVAGNQGMRDQVLALRWIQDNISEFGGDKNKVTVFGESAGAMSVMNLVLSPMAKGLFSAGICQSGSSLSPFCCLNKHPQYYGHKLLEKLGLDPSAPIDTLLQQLQDTPAIDLQVCSSMFEEFVRAPLAFKPIVDGGLVPDPFLPEEPIQLIKKGLYNKVPLIIGSNKDEGMLIKAFYERQEDSYNIGWKNFGVIGALAFFAKEADEVSPKEESLVKEYIKNHFVNTTFSATQEGSDALVEMYGDLLFVAPGDLTCKLMSQQMEQPIYNYLYTQPGTFTLYDIVAYPLWRFGLKLALLAVGLNPWKNSKVCHADELFQMFKTNAFPFDTAQTNQEKKVRASLIDMWTSFAASHNPTPKTGLWKRFNHECPQYLEISSSCRMQYPAAYKSRMEEISGIWEEVPPLYRIMSSPTWKKYPYNRFPVEA